MYEEIKVSQQDVFYLVSLGVELDPLLVGGLGNSVRGDATGNEPLNDLEKGRETRSTMHWPTTPPKGPLVTYSIDTGLRRGKHLNDLLRGQVFAIPRG